MDEVEVECKTPGTYPNLDDIIVEDDGPTLLLPCIVCNKTFKPEVLQRHSKVCEKNTNKKRKTFDSFKQRVKGTDLAEFLPFSSLQKRVSISEKTPSPKKNSSRWKENHEAFVSAIRAARGEGPDEKSGSCASLRPPDHEQCPYCERHFGKKAFDRHQEWCREQHSRQPPVIASSQAKERLEARIKYRAPPIKSKRAITREKYSPLVQRKVRQASPSSHSNFSSNSTTGSASSSASSTRHTSQSQQEQSNRLSKSGSSLSGRSQLKDSTSALGFNRGMAGRTSLRASRRAVQRSNSPPKPSPGSSKLSGSPTQRLSLEDAKLGGYDKDDVFATPMTSKKLLSKSLPIQQTDTKLSDVQPAKPQKKQPSTLLSPTTNLQSLQIEINPKDMKENNNSKSSKNEQLWSGSCQDEPYDPYASAERQMLELLRSDSACSVNKNQKRRSPSPASSLSPMPSPILPLKPSPLETSPTSAFTRYAKDSDCLNHSLTGNKAVEPLKSEILDSDNLCCKEENVKTPSNQLTEPVKLQRESEEHLQSETSEYATKASTKPQPPPRSNKRLASIQHPKNLDELVVSGVSASGPQLGISLDSIQNDVDPSNIDFSNRPKTYDVESRSKKKTDEDNEWCNVTKPSSGDIGSPIILEGADGGKVEVLNLENKADSKMRCETRESREIREITEQDSGIADIDNLLEEVVRMQQSVSMLSDVDSFNSKDALSVPIKPSSARSRRNRAGKMHIEDFLFPAEVLERENNNIRTPTNSSDCSGSLFGSTKSRRSVSKGCRLIEDMLFPPGADFNANSDVNNEDNDVVVSANALSVTYPSPGGFNPKTDLLVTSYPMSPVALTSKAPSNSSSDGLPRPKPMSLSTRNGCNERAEREPGLIPLSPMQAPNQSRQSTSSRLSADSAYSSLNRRSPVPQARRQYPVGIQDVHHHPGDESPQSVLSQSLTQSLVLSSSGSESSLPPLSASQSLKRGSRSKHDCDTPSSDIVSATTPLLPKLSKFCHQCGTKFLISVAKFCHECGAARLEIC